jgi:hypothetical protein
MTKSTLKAGSPSCRIMFVVRVSSGRPLPMGLLPQGRAQERRSFRLRAADLGPLFRGSPRICLWNRGVGPSVAAR